MSIARRTFLTAGLGGGALTAAAPSANPSQPRTKDAIPTPALLLDLDAFEANLKAMADHCRKAGCDHRPHAKTHKCPEIARRQIAAGALGVCVATVPEAEAMVAAGIRGVLLTSPIIETDKIARMVHLANQKGTVLLAVGHEEQVKKLAAAAVSARAVVDVLVDVDVGDRRTGTLPDKPALRLAQRIARQRSLRLRGVQAYAGHASHTVGFARRVKVSQAAMEQAVQTRLMMAEAGLEVPILSGGSTGTYNIDSAIRGVTELQVGSYVFMDVDYRRIGGRTGAVYADFRPSLTVLTTVVSATHADRVTVDAGNKAFATDVPWKPEAKGREGLAYSRAGDEFGTVTVDGGRLPRLGERLEFVVPHCDPTVNLYDRLYAMRGERAEAVWPTAARREVGMTRGGG